MKMTVKLKFFVLLALGMLLLCGFSGRDPVEDMEEFIFELTKYTKRVEGKKYIALTFDDGPNMISTPLLLDILDETNVKATFFVLGELAEQFPDVIKRMAEAGHEIGNHSYKHLELPTLSKTKIASQLDYTNLCLLDITGKRPRLMRPPFGSVNKNVVSVASEKDMAVILWTIDPKDWLITNSAAIANKVIKNAEDGAIVLLHDAHKPSALAAKAIIEELKKQDFEFLTVSDLIHMDRGLEFGAVYKDSKGTIDKWKTSR